MLGTPASGDIGTAVDVASWNQYVAGYVQDDWKLSKRLTVNLGIRYDLELPRYATNNELDWFDFNAASPLNSSVTSLGTLHGGEQFAAVNGNTRRQFDTQYRNFSHGPVLPTRWTLRR